MDLVPLTRSVLYIADFFSLISTVELDEWLRIPGEGDDDFAVRLSNGFLLSHYGWDVAAVSNSIGVMDDNEEDE
jgi:hypothetical protein